MEWRLVSAAVGWTVVLGLAVARGISGVPGVTVWAVVFGQVAMVFTGWLILDRALRDIQADATRERREMDELVVERVALRLAEALREEGTVSSLR